jgi:hypothetical protein
VVDQAIQFYEIKENKERYECTAKLEKVAADFNEIKSLVKGKLKPFNYYRKRFLVRELKYQLTQENLDLFFKFHKGFTTITLKDLLPYRIIGELKQAKWPQFLQVQEESKEIKYIGQKAFIEMDHTFFAKIDRQELMLPTGEWAGVIMGERKFHEWDLAVYEYNRWKKTELYEKKFKDLEKPGYMDDLLEVPFPQPFEAGSGKDKKPFEYYIVPKIKGKDVVLVHYFEKENAESYFESIRSQWQEYYRLYKKSKIENIFKQKGWKVT